MNTALRRMAAFALVGASATWPAVQAADAATPKASPNVEAAAAATVWAGYSHAGFSVAPWGCSAAWGGCLGPRSWRMLLERQRRFDDLRQDPTAAAPAMMTNPWYGWSGAPLPPPTPEKQIQPAYRDRSVLRPEFRDAGQMPR